MTTLPTTKNIIQSETALLPWKEANKIRGVKYSDVAEAFVKSFPVGSRFTAEEFDQWLEKSGLLTIPPADAPKNSDAWLGHLQRRHIQRERINKAGNHPRMIMNDVGPFIIMSNGRAGFQVMSPEAAASMLDLPRKVQSLTVTKRRQLEYLMQSTDWTRLPPYQQVVARMIFKSIDNFKEDIATTTRRIDNQFQELKSEIQKAMESGDVKSTNGGLLQLFDETSDVK